MFNFFYIVNTEIKNTFFINTWFCYFTIQDTVRMLQIDNICFKTHVIDNSFFNNFKILYDDSNYNFDLVLKNYSKQISVTYFLDVVVKLQIINENWFCNYIIDNKNLNLNNFQIENWTNQLKYWLQISWNIPWYFHPLHYEEALDFYSVYKNSIITLNKINEPKISVKPTVYIGESLDDLLLIVSKIDFKYYMWEGFKHLPNLRWLIVRLYLYYKITMSCYYLENEILLLTYKFIQYPIHQIQYLWNYTKFILWEIFIFKQMSSILKMSFMFTIRHFFLNWIPYNIFYITPIDYLIDFFNSKFYKTIHIKNSILVTKSPIWYQEHTNFANILLNIKTHGLHKYNLIYTPNKISWKLQLLEYNHYDFIKKYRCNLNTCTILQKYFTLNQTELYKILNYGPRSIRRPNVFKLKHIINNISDQNSFDIRRVSLKFSTFHSLHLPNNIIFTPSVANIKCILLHDNQINLWINPNLNLYLCHPQSANFYNWYKGPEIKNSYILSKLFDSFIRINALPNYFNLQFKLPFECDPLILKNDLTKHINMRSNFAINTSKFNKEFWPFYRTHSPLTLSDMFSKSCDLFNTPNFLNDERIILDIAKQLQTQSDYLILLNNNSMPFNTLKDLSKSIDEAMIPFFEKKRIDLLNNSEKINDFHVINLLSSINDINLPKKYGDIILKTVLDKLCQYDKITKVESINDVQIKITLKNVILKLMGCSVQTEILNCALLFAIILVTAQFCQQLPPLLDA